MSAVQFNDGEEVVETDLNNIAKALECDLYVIMWRMLGSQFNIVFADSFICSKTNATTTDVAGGIGFQADVDYSDPEPWIRPLYIDGGVSAVHAAAHATLDRIDRICIRHDRATADSEDRNVKDADDDTVSVESVVKLTEWRSEILVVEGTAAGSPVAPATPDGYLSLATVVVTAVTGIANNAAYTDTRKVHVQGSVVYETDEAYTIEMGVQTVLADASGGAFSVTLPPAAMCFASDSFASIELVIKNVGASGVVTIDGHGSETIDGATTQTLDAQYSSMSLRTNGTNWFIV